MAPKPTLCILKKLRALMQDTQYVSTPLQAYIVPSADPHQSEYLAECDKRRMYVSGFTGSAGTAVITMDKALMWTDGRYYLQANEQMDASWTLMKDGLPATPPQGVWLANNLPSGSNVGVDPNLLSLNRWLPLKDQLEAGGCNLIGVERNLVDIIWESQPKLPSNPPVPLALKYTGKTVGEKLAEVREKMEEKRCTVLVLTFLDEIAWLLNMRGSDIEYNPVFFAYVIVTNDQLMIFIDQDKFTKEANKHLMDEVGETKFMLNKYEEIKPKLKSLIDSTEGRIWCCHRGNSALASMVPHTRLIQDHTPIQLMKAIKNDVEKQGMRNSHIRDGVALACYFSWLEKEVLNGTSVITEMSGADKLLEFRAEQEDFVGPSFTTISASGPNASRIHYEPTKETDLPITKDSVYMCDSGGQYRDGTTDVTRTMHFGTPTDFQMETFTRVLKGQIQVAAQVFPTKIKGNCLDSFARQYLWAVGLDYGHGTGHGIGMYLNVHEGPMEVSWRTSNEDPGLEAGMFISNEPGYYQDNEFGIRLEDIVEIVPATAEHNFNNRGYLTFNTITLCPIQTKMIKKELFTQAECDRLNEYHQRCRDVLGPLLDAKNLQEAKAWLWRETEPFSLK